MERLNVAKCRWKDVDLEMFAAHATAYESVKSSIQKEIITNHNVMPLSVLWDHYINQLEQENYPNPRFCSKKFKKNIEKDESILQLILFSWKGCISLWLIFSFRDVNLKGHRCIISGSFKRQIDVANFIREVVLEYSNPQKKCLVSSIKVTVPAHFIWVPR